MAATIPRRLTLAVEKLAVSGDETILEIGCGRGLAVALLCSRLRGGTITAIDRSTTAIEAARKLNRGEAARRKAFFYEASIEAFDGQGRLFDIVFAINLNLFWLGSAKGLASVRRLLAKGGRLHLFYDPPSAGQSARIAAALPLKLAAGGFELVEPMDADPSNLIAVAARPTEQ